MSFKHLRLQSISLFITVTCFLICTGWVSGVSAQTDGTDKKSEAAASAQTLPEVTVTGKYENPATGTSVIDQEMIQQMPGGNNSISEALRILPDVQVADDFRAADYASEIAPPAISISGGKSYENLFQIDGTYNNSLLDPAANDPELKNDLPGHAQSFFLDARFLDHITLYDSNIPARFGDFSGGVVDAKTADPLPFFSSGLSYRTTRSSWTRFFSNNQIPEDDDNGSSPEPVDPDPRFEKHDIAADVHIPLSDTSAMMLGYRYLDSQIPKVHFDGTRSERRTSHNVLGKWLKTRSGGGTVGFNAIYAPYYGTYFRQDVSESDYTIDSGGGSISGEMTGISDMGSWVINTGISASGSKRDAPDHYRSWLASNNKSWGATTGDQFSEEGGFGDIDKSQTDIQLGGELTALDMSHASVRHRVSGGFDYHFAAGSFERKTTTYDYDDPVASATVYSPNNTFDCDDFSQYFAKRTVYRKDSASEALNRFAFYLEDILTWRRLTLTPGLRTEFDDFTENLNIAPRLAGTWDIFGDGATQISLGLNRYYAGTFITQKLREAKAPTETEVRRPYQNRVYAGFDETGTMGGYWWSTAENNKNTETYSSLNTPYSDEIAVGLDQFLFGGDFSIKYVSRYGEDQYYRTYGPVQSNGLRYFTMTNNGSYDHQSFRISWQRMFHTTFLAVNATYQTTSSSNETYNDILTDDPSESRVWFDDSIIYKSELPREKFNRPVIANLIMTVPLPCQLSFTNITQLRGAYDNLENTFRKKEVPSGMGQINPLTGDPVSEALYVYESIHRPATMIFDWKLSWSPTLKQIHHFTATLEVNNVFNVKNLAPTKDNSYETGRQFWLGASYRF